MTSAIGHFSASDPRYQLPSASMPTVQLPVPLYKTLPRTRRGWVQAMVRGFDDRWLWVGLGVFTILAVKGVAYGLRTTLSLTEIHNEEQKQICAISQDTEDDLDAKSLAILAQSHDRAIRDSAIQILVDRFLRDQPAITSLTCDIYSPNPTIRARANVLRNLLEHYVPDHPNVSFLSYPAPGNEQHSGWDSGWFSSRLREQEESVEEQELRRRRREAVVFNEGGPVRQDDIFQRGTNGVPVPRRRTNEQETRMLEDMMSQVTAGSSGVPRRR